MLRISLKPAKETKETKVEKVVLDKVDKEVLAKVVLVKVYTHLSAHASSVNSQDSVPQSTETLLHTPKYPRSKKSPQSPTPNGHQSARATAAHAPRLNMLQKETNIRTEPSSSTEPSL